MPLILTSHFNPINPLSQVPFPKRTCIWLSLLFVCLSWSQLTRLLWRTQSLLSQGCWLMLTELWELSCCSFPYQQFFSLLEFTVPMPELAVGEEDVHTSNSSRGTNLPKQLSLRCCSAQSCTGTQTHIFFCPFCHGGSKHQQRLGAGIWKQQHPQRSSQCLTSTCCSSPGAQQHIQSCTSVCGWMENRLKTHTPLLHLPPHGHVAFR